MKKTYKQARKKENLKEKVTWYKEWRKAKVTENAADGKTEEPMDWKKSENLTEEEEMAILITRLEQLDGKDGIKPEEVFKEKLTSTRLKTGTWGRPANPQLTSD